MEDQNIQDVATNESISENAQSPDAPQTLNPPDPSVRYDWFKGELAGLNQNLADLYHQGFTPELQEMGKADEYWSDVNIRTPFEQKYGENAKAEFDKVYKASEEKLKAYTDHHFDIRYTSFAKTPVRDVVTSRLEKMGLISITDPKIASQPFVKTPKYVDPWGRHIESMVYGSDAMRLSEPEFGWREGAKTVYDAENNTFIPVDEYLQKNPGANLVHAANEDGSPAVGPDNLNYLRPLKYGEDKKTYEEYYSGKEDWLGSKGLYRSDWYALQWLPKNAFNFMGDTLDSGAELLKIFDNAWQSGDQSSWDKALTEFQNDVNSVLYVPTSEQGKEHWYTVEGISDGIAQIGGQLFGMKGVGWGIKSLTALAKMGKGTRAAQIGSQLWMATLASDEIAKEGRENGLSPKEIAAAYTLYTAGVYKIAGLSEKVINPVTTKALQGQIIRDFTKQLGVAKEVGGGKISLPGMFQAVKNGIAKLDDGLTNLLTSESKAAQLAGAGLGESAEEMTEVFWDKGFKEGYNAIWGSYAGDDDFKALTDPNKDARFKVSWENLPAELAAAGALGFAGGGLFKAADLFTNNTETKRKTIIGYGAYGEGYDGLRKRANDDWNNDRILPGQKKVDVYGKPTDKEENSRAYLAYKAIINEIDMAEGLWKAYGADKAIAQNLQALGGPLAEIGNTVLSNYNKVMGEDADLRNTDLPKHLVDTLHDISQLEGELTQVEGLSKEDVSQKQEKLKTLKARLADVVSGKNANDYLLQSLFNADPMLGYGAREGVKEDSRLTFQEYVGANNYIKTRQDEVKGLVTSTDNINLQQAVDQKIKIVKGGDVYNKLQREINDRYVEDGMFPVGEDLEKYNAELSQLESLVYNKSANPLDDFGYTINENGLPGASFNSILKSLEDDAKKSQTDGSIIFDDVEKIDRVFGQLQKRMQQLHAMSELNPKANSVFKTDAASENKFPTIAEEDVIKVTEELNGYLGRLATLRNIAIENKSDFFKSANQASQNQMLFTSKVMSNIADFIRNEGSYSDLLPLIEEDLVGLVSSTDKNNFEVYHSKVTQQIHNYFKDKQKEAITNFSGNKLILGEDNYTYLKAIVLLDPSQFKAAYADSLNSMSSVEGKDAVKDMRTPFPAQDRNIYRIASWLTTKVNPITRPDTGDPNRSASRFTLTESYFLRDEQGSGKTLVALMGLKIAQTLNGGKAAIFALNNEIRKKAYLEATRNLKIEVDASIKDSNSAQDILNYITENNSQNLKDVRYIVIDEATLYSVDDLAKIDAQIAQINKDNYMGEGQVPIKILLMGDPMQTGFVRNDPDYGPNTAYNVGDLRHTLERSEMTRFSWRTGNQDILEVLRHIRNMANSIDRVSEIVVKYDKAKKSGYMTTDNFEESVLTMTKDKDVNVDNYFVITDDHEMKAKLRARGVPEQNILTPSQVQGQERDYVFVHIPVTQSDFEMSTDVQNFKLKAILTSVGRAKKMVITEENPLLKIRSVPGESFIRTSAFEDAQLETLRNERLGALAASGVKDVIPKPVALNSAPLVISKVVEIVEREEKPITTQDAEKWLDFVKSLREKVGEEAYIASFYTRGFSYDESGKESPMAPEDALRIKNQITTSTLPLDADSVNFVLQYQRNEIPSEVYDTYSEAVDEKRKNEPKLILIARLMKGSTKVAEVTFGALQGIQNPQLPIDADGRRVISLEYTPEKSAQILQRLRENRKDAAINVIDAFSEPRKQRRTAEENTMNRKEMSASEFMRKNTSHNYASSVWQVTLPGRTEKTPYLFYSYNKNTQDIDKLLTEAQATSVILQQRAGKKEVALRGNELVQESLTYLRKEHGILGIALNGGRIVEFDTFLEGMAEEFKQNVSQSDRKFDLSTGARTRIKNFIDSELELELDKENGAAVIDAKAYNKIEKKKFNSDYKQYLADVTKSTTTVIFENTEPVEEVDSEGDDAVKPDKKLASKNTKRRGVRLSPIKRRFKPLAFLNKLHSDLKDPDNKANAERLIRKLKTDVFKYGVYSTSPTVRGSTTDVDVAFGQAELSFENFSVPGYTSPAMPIFAIPMDLLTVGSAEDVREVEINKIQTINSTPVNAARPDILPDPVRVLKDSEGGSERQFDEMQPKEDGGAARQIEDIAKVWFSGTSNAVFLEEFGYYFRDKVYSTIFPLVGENPSGIVISSALNKAISDFRDEVSAEGFGTVESMKSAVSNLTVAEFANSFLKLTPEIKTNRKTGYHPIREQYYKVVMAYEFDSLLSHYFDSIKKINGQYTFVNKSYKHNPAAQEEIKPHLATGSSIAKMHLFNTPLIQKDRNGQYYIDRKFNNEDYAMLLRDMQDNDITSLPKALRYFDPEVNKGLGSRIQQIKFSMHQRFFANEPLVIDGMKHHSLMSASRNSGSEEIRRKQMEEANNSITALLSFLASGNESEFVRVLYNEDGTFGTTGRLTSISSSPYRQDLEGSIENSRAKNEIAKKDGKPSLVQYDDYFDTATFRFQYGKGFKSINIGLKDGIYVFSDVTKTDGSSKKVDTPVLTALLRSLGLPVNDRMTQKLTDENPTNLGSVVLSLAKHFANPNSIVPFADNKLIHWISVSNAIQDMSQVQSAYGYKLINNERVNLQSLAPTYVRNNQLIKELSESPVQGPLKSLDVVRTESNTSSPTRSLRFTGYMLKEGFISEDGQFGKHVTRFTDREQLKYDFHHLYLGFMYRNMQTGRNTNAQTLAFAPIPFSDKGSAGVVKATADFMMNNQRIGNQLNIPAMRARTIQQINDYYRNLGVSIWSKWSEVLNSKLGISLDFTPIVESSDSIIASLNNINAVIMGLNEEQKQILVNSDLVPNLHYSPRNTISPIKQSIIDKIDIASLEAMLDRDLINFNEQLREYGILSAPYTNELGISFSDAVESFFWNRNWVAHNFTALNVGPIEQYKSGSEYADAVKRASQVSTPRMRMITRDPSKETDLIEGRKLSEFSLTAIVSDIKRFVNPISYNKAGGVEVKIYDGAAFHNIYTTMMYKASLGGNHGFNVGANLKPISTYLDEETGATRYDKYASFRISRQMVEEGSDFINAIDRLMKDSVKFSSYGKGPFAVGGSMVDSLYELEQAAFKNGMTEEDVMDIMVKNGVQDLFIHELTFDSSVKNGISNLNKFGTQEDLIAAQSLSYVPRSNKELGLVLDASHDSDGQYGTFGSQHLSAMLQTRETSQQASNILEAIRIIGDKGREEIVNDKYVDRIRTALNSRNTVGMIQQIINTPNPSMSNKMLMSMGYSNLASALSNLTIGFQIYGGQQVLAPATGIWEVVETESGKVFTRRAGDKILGVQGRELNGFDAKRNGESIKDTEVWQALKAAVDSGNKLEEVQLRDALYNELKTGGWEIQPVEIVLSPTHFKAFGIPAGTHISEINEFFFAELDKEKMLRRFTAGSIADAALRKEYSDAKANGDSEKMASIEERVVNAKISENADQYIRKKQDFDKTLEIMMGRIPATHLHTLTPFKVVGFSHDVDNTVYVHPDVLVFHGADQDIDKGNIYAYEVENGRVDIPEFANGVWTLNGEEVSESALTEVQLKNYIVSQLNEAYRIPETSLVSTMPTDTAMLDAAIENIPEQNQRQSPYNPATAAEFYTRGQGGKTSTGITAVGLKEYSTMVFSSRIQGKEYDYYVPKSDALSNFDGDVARISDDVDALVTFDNFLQAALDNAKDPKLGRASVNEHNNALISALGLHGYTPEEVVSFISNPLVKGVFNQYASTREFSTSYTERKTISQLISESPFKDDPYMQDLAYFQSFAEKMTDLGKILATNREIPNNPFASFTIANSFNNFISGISTPANSPLPRFDEFMEMSESQRRTAARDFEEYAPKETRGFTHPINIYQVVNDNKHIFSYLKSFVQLDKMFRQQSPMYNDLMNGAVVLGDSIKKEDAFNSYIDMMYGFAVDSYLARRGESSIVTMGGKKYDLRRHISTTEIKGRSAFMNDFPSFFDGLKPKSTVGNNNLQSVLMAVLVGKNSILKPQGNYREYSVEKKAFSKEMMRTADNQFDMFKGDSSLKKMLFLYSLIKDKGGVSGTNYTEMFDYTADGFYDFDSELQRNPISRYVEYLKPGRTEDFIKIFKAFGKGQSLSKELREDKEFMSTRKFMRDNSHAIPYSSNITFNDKYPYESVVTPTAATVLPITGSQINFEQLQQGFEAFGSMVKSMQQIAAQLAQVNQPPVVKSQRNYMDSTVRRAVSYNTNRNMISSFATKLGRRFGVSTQILNTAEIREQYSADLSTRKGFTVGNTVVINTDLMTIDTPIHEFTHIWMAGLKQEDPDLYDRIISEASKHPYMETIQEQYPELDEEGVAEEVFVTLTGLYNSGRVNSALNRGFLSKARNLFDRFINWIKQTFSDIFGGEISVNDSLTDIMGQLGESMISAMDMSQDDAKTLNLLGVNLIAGNSELSALRERMRLQKRYEKIC